MRLKKNGGFTLIEVIVVAGIIAILAGILVPLVLKEIDESRITRATADVRSIYTAVVVFKKDIGQWPVMNADCDPAVSMLTGKGASPSNLAAMGYDDSAAELYSDHLSTNANNCYNNWKGPYIADVTADPWGNAYITNANAFQVQGGELGSDVWIISAGPNGLIDTPVPNAGGALVGDDIGLRFK